MLGMLDAASKVRVLQATQKVCFSVDGVVAQLVERLVRNEKVRGSIPLNSTKQNFEQKRLARCARRLSFQPMNKMVF